jgi:hypothetical protein
MNKKKADTAVSEIIGTVMLLGITVTLFSVLSIVVLSFPLNPSSPAVNLVGLVDEGNIIIEHRGGETLHLETKIILVFTRLEIGDIRVNFTARDYLDGDSLSNRLWNIGEKIVYDPSQVIKDNIAYYQVTCTVVDVESNSVIMRGIIQEGEIGPTVETLDATDITNTSATLWMKYNFRFQTGDLRFVYKSEGATAWEQTSWESYSGSGFYSKGIMYLTEWTTYIFKAQLRYDSTIIEGEPKTFYTATYPDIETLNPTDFKGSSAKIHMSYDFKDYGSGYVRFAYKADWMNSWLYESKDPNDPEGWDAVSGSNDDYSITITGLSKGTTYIYKAQLKFDSTIIEGEEKSFISGPPPDLSTLDATDVTTNSATLNMNYNFVDYDIGELRFKYKVNGTSIWIKTPWEGYIGSGVYSKPILGLSSGTTYIFKAQLNYEMGLIEGNEKSFTTEV